MIRCIRIATSKKRLLVFTALALLTTALLSQEYKSGIVWQEPPIVDPGETDHAPPSDAIVLFDGTDLSKWNGGDQWEIVDGAALTRGGDITSKEQFGDCQIHIEWATPKEIKGQGQGRGNSGVYLMGRYEVQILDSYNNTTYYDGQAGAIYKQFPPLVNASRGPGQWQTYDILFTAPRFDEHGQLITPGYVTVLHNGVVIQNHTELLGNTAYNRPPRYQPHGPVGPIRLQHHGNPVRFRNIWIRPLKPRNPVYPG